MIDRKGGEVSWWGYVEWVTKGSSVPKIARLLEMDQSTVNRWRLHAPKPKTVTAFARAYDRPVLEAFIAAEFLSAEDAGEVPAAAPDLSQLSNEELIEELSRRIGG